MNIRKFNRDGVNAFREAIIDQDMIRDRPTDFLKLINEISTSPKFSDELKGEIDLKPFNDRFLFAEYIYNSLTAISNLIANAPYSKLQDTRIISKRNLEVLEEKFNQTQMMFDRLKDCSIATEMRIQKTKIALEQVNERLQ